MAAARWNHGRLDNAQPFPPSSANPTNGGHHMLRQSFPRPRAATSTQLVSRGVYRPAAPAMSGSGSQSRMSGAAATMMPAVRQAGLQRNHLISQQVAEAHKNY